MKAKDLMIPLHEYLRQDNTIKEAAYLLRITRRGEKKIGVKALPVLDATGKLVGILSIGDILKAVYPAYMYLMDLGKFTWDGMVETFAKGAANKKVEDLMTRKVITVKEDSTLMECIDHIASANVIVVGMAEKMGKPISFKKFMLYGMPLMIESVIICTVYVWLRYYVLKI